MVRLRSTLVQDAVLSKHVDQGKKKGFEDDAGPAWEVIGDRIR